MATASKNIRVLMLCDFYHPFDRGGSEHSVFHLQKSLFERDVNSAVFTPDYQKTQSKVYKKIQIFRFSFFPKLKLKHHGVSPIWYLNLVFWLISIISLAKITSKYKPQVLHVQGKYLLPAAIVVGKWKGIPVIVTVRDYLLLCPLSFCISKNNAYKACDLVHVLSKDLPYYFQTYQLSVKNKLFTLLGVIYGWVIMRLYRWLLNFAHKRVAVSQKVKEIYEVNNVRINEVIYNSFVAPAKNRKLRRTNSIIFVGRLTKGKGMEVLVKAYQRLRMNRQVTLNVLGDGMLGSTIDQLNKKSIILHGKLSYKATLMKISRAKILIAPSLWEEPFGRVVLEALMLGTPVIVSDRGGLPEIVNHLKNGIIIVPTAENLYKSIGYLLDNYDQFYNETLNSFSALQLKFYFEPQAAYANLYRELI